MSAIKVDRTVQIVSQSIDLRELKNLVAVAYNNGLTDSARVTVEKTYYGGDQRDNSPSVTRYTIKVSA